MVAIYKWYLNLKKKSITIVHWQSVNSIRHCGRTWGSEISISQSLILEEILFQNRLFQYNIVSEDIVMEKVFYSREIRRSLLTPMFLLGPLILAN